MVGGHGGIKPIRVHNRAFIVASSTLSAWSTG
jgi:hypothetical protein